MCGFLGLNTGNVHLSPSTSLFWPVLKVSLFTERLMLILFLRTNIFFVQLLTLNKIESIIQAFQINGCDSYIPLVDVLKIFLPASKRFVIALGLLFVYVIILQTTLDLRTSVLRIGNWV